MFKTLIFFWDHYWKSVKRGKPNMRAFMIFFDILMLDIISLFLTGYTIDEKGN